MKTFILLFASTMLLISCGGKTETGIYTLIIKTNQGILNKKIIIN